ncbi:hypothetical protein QD46_25370 [Paenibacillus polymyxa]|nr:hypothetical protein QD46_25370 [Paenibacillus polymyxa]
MEQYYTLLSNLLNSMENISNAIVGDDTNEFNDIFAGFDLFKMSLDEQINDFKGKLEKYQRCKSQLQNAKSTYFSVYKIGNKTFQGFTLGEHLDGWEKPYFTKQQALKVVTAVSEFLTLPSSAKWRLFLYAVWQLLNYNPYSKSQRFTNKDNLYSPRCFTHSCLDNIRTDAIICFTISASTIV